MELALLARFVRRATVPLPERARDLRNLALIIAGFVSVLLLVPPRHEYPVLDDYLYADSVRTMLQTGTFAMPNMSQTSLIGLVVWGALWAKLLGFSFSVLTYSVLALAALGLLAFYGVAREVGVPPAGALLGTALLGFNPMFVHLSYMFMTDVPFLALVLAASYCYIRGLNVGGARAALWLVIAGLLAGWSFLIRQFGVLVPAAFGGYLLLDGIVSRRWNWRGILLTALVPGAIIGGWWIWWHNMPPTGAALSAGSRAAGFMWKPLWARVFFVRSVIFLPFVALFAWATLKLRRRRWWLVPICGLALAWAVSAITLAPDTAVAQLEPTFTAQIGPISWTMPQEEYTFGLIGSIVRQVGIDFDEFGYSQQPIWTPEAWHSLWAFGMALGVLLLAKFADGLLDWRPGVWRRKSLTPLFGFYLLGLLIYVGVTAIPGDVFARYLLGFLPFVILFVVRGSTDWGRFAWGYSVATAFALAVFTMLAKADQMDHQGLRWQAGLWMEARYGAAHVGWNWDHWGHTDSDIYRIVDTPDEGFRVVQRFPYLSRLSGFTTRYVLAEAKADDSHAQILVSPPWTEARGVAVLPDGRVAMGDAGSGRLTVYRADGQPDTSWTATSQFSAPSDLAVSADGRLAVLDAGNGNVTILGGDGKTLAQLPRATTGIGAASGIAWAPNGGLYVADTGGGRVVHLKLDGSPLVALVEGQSGVPLPDQPLDVVIGGDGKVYAVDLQGRLVRFNAAGQTEQEWKVAGGGGTRGGSHLAAWGRPRSRLPIPTPTR